MKKSVGILMKSLVQLLLVVVVIAVGLGVFKWLKSHRKPPVKVDRPVVTPLVEAVTVDMVHD